MYTMPGAAVDNKELMLRRLLSKKNELSCVHGWLNLHRTDYSTSFKMSSVTVLHVDSTHPYFVAQ